jgi:RNA polymerase sigma factor (sigma-70 family)
VGGYALVTPQSKVSFTGTVETDYDFKRDFQMKDYENWLRGIVHIVLKNVGNNARWDFDELMGEAFLALCESAESFNPEFNNSLLGYAKPHIFNRLYHFCSRSFSTFKVRYYNIYKDEEKMAKVKHMEQTLWTDNKSKGQEVSSDGDVLETPLEAHASGQMQVDDELALTEECEILRNIVNSDLKKRERRAIVRRHRDNESFQEIGDKLGISKESARRTYIRGMDKLKTKAAQAGIKVEE